MAFADTDGGIGAVGNFPLEQWFWEMPVCTRVWTTATVLTSVLLQCKAITPFQLFYSFRAVYVKSQYWRLFTTFTFIGPLSLDLVLHLFFLQRYSRLLESGSNSSAHYSWLLLFCTSLLLILSTLFLSQPFLGTALSSTLVYIWSRRNPDTILGFMEVLAFSAPYLPWVLMTFSFCFHGTIPRDEILGVLVGHISYFLTDVWPGMHDGQRPLDPPSWWIRLWEGRRQDEPEQGSPPRDIDGDMARAVAVGNDLR